MGHRAFWNPTSLPILLLSHSRLWQGTYQEQIKSNHSQAVLTQCHRRWLNREPFPEQLSSNLLHGQRGGSSNMRKTSATSTQHIFLWRTKKFSKHSGKQAHSAIYVTLCPLSDHQHCASTTSLGPSLHGNSILALGAWKGELQSPH